MGPQAHAPAPPRSPQPVGLTRGEVAAREAAGQANVGSHRPSRTVGQILRANAFTRFNAILGALLAVILVVGPLQDALFGIVLIANMAIGIIQELRAKRALDRLAVLTAPRAVAVRDGASVELAVERVVLGDVVRLRAGDQVVVDGELLVTEGLEVDESLLTGEAEPIPKHVGDEVLSGSFAAAGSGWYRATRVGPAAYAASIALDARRFALTHSELRAGVDRILRWITWLMVPTAALLVSTQLIHNEDLADALRGSVAGVGSMVPEGLVLLTSLAMAVGVVRLARQRVLVQELAAIETLARVDVVCLDKTGTLTEGVMTVAAVDALGPAPAPDALAALAAADTAPNSSMQAIRRAFPAPKPWAAEAVVPFSSARKWSAASFGEHGAWVLGAPEILIEHATSLDPAALVVLEDPIRPQAAATIAYFKAQGVGLKVLSGDDPRTAVAIAGRLDLLGSTAPVDARRLPVAPEELAEAVEAGTVFGRVSPHQKLAMVAALQSRGHVVAMVGDGVNDVLALKQADIGVAFASGSGVSRAVAQVLLVDNSFDTLPAVVAEGRRVIANIERVASLFLTKTVYASLLALAVGVARLPFPFLPRHLTVVTALTIGLPAFFLALAPNAARARPGFVRRVLTFAVPAGTVAATATFLTYAAMRTAGVDLAAARTLATVVLFAVAFWVLTVVARPLTAPRRWLLAAMVCSFGCVFTVAPIRNFFGLVPAPLFGWATAAAAAVLAVAAVELGWHLVTGRHMPARARLWLGMFEKVDGPG